MNNRAKQNDHLTYFLKDGNKIAEMSNSKPVELALSLRARMVDCNRHCNIINIPMV